LYALYKIKDTVRVPPKEFGQKLEKAVLKISQEEYEGVVDEDLGIIIAVTGAANVGEGKVVPGDGAAYHEAELDLLVFKPELLEIVEGSVSEITEFGAFIKIGPMEALVHVSQIMDDYINYDAKSTVFSGKESGKKLMVEDMVLARIVSCSLKNSVQNSKIGLTMRQLGLGKTDWLALDLNPKEKKIKGKPTGKPPKQEMEREERKKR
jgi:DNA-directed RNA polymerase subunit E'